MILIRIKKIILRHFLLTEFFEIVAAAAAATVKHASRYFFNPTMRFNISQLYIISI